MSKFTNYQVFVAVVEHKSITRAASRLNLSAPAVSKQLAQLEQRLQVQLFHRSHKKLDLASAGKQFYPKCKAILSSISLAEEELLSEHESISGTISITLSRALCRSKIFDILSAFGNKYPLVDFDIYFSDKLENMHDKNIDFAFRLGKLSDNSHIIAMPLIDTQLVACATPQYLDKHGVPESFSDLDKAKLIVMSPLEASEELRKFLNKEKVKLNNSLLHKTNDIEGVYQLVKANLGIGMMLDISIQRELNEGVFESILSERNLPRKRLYLLSKKSQLQTEKQRVFKHHVRSSFSSIDI
ncbi:MAG: LysR family transcriptional regulator [Arenicella sp.]